MNDYGCNKEYAIKCVQMNKHNSVSSTYYLLLKSKKQEYVKQLRKEGKVFNKYFEVSNEKQELIDLLMNYESSSKKSKIKKAKITENFKDDNQPKKEFSKNKMIKEFMNKNRQVENIEIVSNSKSQERKSNKHMDNGMSIEYNTIDYCSNITSIKNEKKKPQPEFQTVDYSANVSRNNNTFVNTDKPEINSLKQKQDYEMTKIKNRRTGSTD